MAYCRCGSDSDFYVLLSTKYTCWPAYVLKERDGLTDEYFDDPASLYQHLMEMRERGYRVPQRALDRLENEMMLR